MAKHRKKTSFVEHLKVYILKNTDKITTIKEHDNSNLLMDNRRFITDIRNFMIGYPQFDQRISAV